MMVPRWQVLNEADRILDEALAGHPRYADDADLIFMVRALRLREMKQKAAYQMLEAWERFKMSPMFKLWCFYVALFGVSMLAQIVQKKIEKRKI